MLQWAAGAGGGAAAALCCSSRGAGAPGRRTASRGVQRAPHARWGGRFAGRSATGSRLRCRRQQVVLQLQLRSSWQYCPSASCGGQCCAHRAQGSGCARSSHPRNVGGRRETGEEKGKGNVTVRLRCRTCGRACGGCSRFLPPSPCWLAGPSRLWPCLQWWPFCATALWQRRLAWLPPPPPPPPPSSPCATRCCART